MAGPNAASQRSSRAARRLGRRHPGDAVGQPLVHRHPAVLRARPPALGPAAHDALLGRQQEQDPRRQPDQPLPLLALAEQQLLAQLGDRLRELGAGHPLAAVEGGDRLGLGAAEPAGTVLGDAVGLDQRDQLPALGHGQRVGARRLDDGHEIEGDDEHRPPHAQRAHQRPPLVERVLQRGDRGRRPGQAGGGGEEDRRRVGAVQADQVTGQGRDVIDLGAGGEVVAPTEPGAAFGVADVPHPPGAGAQASAGSNRWYSVSSSSAPGALGGQDLEVVQRGVDVARPHLGREVVEDLDAVAVRVAHVDAVGHAVVAAQVERDPVGLQVVQLVQPRLARRVADGEVVDADGVVGEEAEPVLGRRRDLVGLAHLHEGQVVVVGAGAVEAHLALGQLALEEPALLVADDLGVEAVRGLDVAHGQHEVRDLRSRRRPAGLCRRHRCSFPRGSPWPRDTVDNATAWRPPTTKHLLMPGPGSRRGDEYAPAR